jgi:hypothetical protein
MSAYETYEAGRLQREQARLLIRQAWETGDVSIIPSATPKKPLGTIRPKISWRTIVIEALRARDGNCCYICRRELDSDPQVDHVVPTTLDGDHALHNLALTHERCNLAKGTAVVAVVVNTRGVWYLPQ